MPFTYRSLQNKFLIRFYNKALLSILTSFPPVTNHAVFIWCVKCKTTTVCKRISLVTGGGGGKHFSKTFSIFYMLNSKNRVFSPYFFNRYFSNEKTAFVDKSRIEPTIFLIEKISFSLKLFSGHFYGQSFIKTVRGPFLTIKYILLNDEKRRSIWP